MDRWSSQEKSERNDKYGQRLKNPSFSSALLDAIYRSTDEEELVLYKATMRKNQCIREDELSRDYSLRRACRVEKWMDKKVNEKVMLRRKASELERIEHEDGFQKFHRDQQLFQSSSCSDESSDNGTNCGFSSSEAESVNKARSSAFTANRPKPVRTSVAIRPAKSAKSPPSCLKKTQINGAQLINREQFQMRSSSTVKDRNPSHKTKEEGFNKSKSRASRFYSDFKKAKQPISPGSKLASFLNSLFMAGSAKKAKISASTASIDNASCDSSTERKSNQVSSCSSASSSLYSRSCLSKTPSSRGKPINGVRRSVRFYPMSIIVGEDSRPCGHKCLYLPEEQNLMALTAGEKAYTVPLLSEKLKLHLLEKNKHVQEAAKDLLKEYQKKSNFLGEVMRDIHEDADGDDEEDDDAASYSSSDLFELENLAAVGIDRYQEELPVYETTHLETNQAIAKGLLL